MNIVLIGMRGSGKSTIAKKLSKKLNMPTIEMDKAIAQENNMPIPEMVTAYGWEYFRDKETAMTHKVCQQDNTIISTGGGVVIREANRKLLQNNSIIFYLKAAIPTLLRRIGKDANRPALTAQKSMEDEIKEVLRNRKTLYEQTANHIIDTDRKSVNRVVEEILMYL